MARLREIPFVLRTIGPWTFTKRIYREIGADGVFNMAAAVAYYWLLAVFPLAIFLASLATVMPHSAKEALKQKMGVWIYTVMTGDVAYQCYLTFNHIIDTPNVALLSVGVVLTLWAASNGMNATMTALDRCYNVTKPRPFVQQRFISIVITVCGVLIALMLGLLLPVSTYLLKLIDRSPNYLPVFARGGTRMGIDITRYSIGVTLVILLVSSIYQFGVSIRRRWTLITPGAVFAVFGVMAMAYVFNWYISRFGEASYNKTYGVLGGVVIVLLLFNFYAVIFLIGAEINSEIDFAVLQGREKREGDDLLDTRDDPEFEHFRRQLERRGARFLEVRGKRAKEVEAGTDEEKASV